VRAAKPLPAVRAKRPRRRKFVSWSNESQNLSRAAIPTQVLQALPKRQHARLGRRTPTTPEQNLQPTGQRSNVLVFNPRTTDDRVPQPAVTPEHLPQVTVFVVGRSDAPREDLGLHRIATVAAMLAAAIDPPVVVDTEIVADHRNAVEPELEPEVDTHHARLEIAAHQAQDREALRLALADPVLLVVLVVSDLVEPAPEDQAVQVDRADPVPEDRQAQVVVARAAQVAPVAVAVAAAARLLLLRIVVRNKSVRQHEDVAEKAITTRRIATKRSRLASRTRSPYPRSTRCRKRSTSWRSLRYRILLEK